MKNKNSYPGFSIVFSIGSYHPFKFEKDLYSIKIKFLWFTIMLAKKNMDDLLDSYITALSDRIKELSNEHERIRKNSE